MACTGTLTACSQDDGGSAISAHDPAGDAIYLENLQRSFADFYAIDDPPAVPVARWLVPEELDAVLRSCLGEEGFSVEPDGSYFTPPEQSEAWQLAQYTCRMSYPIVREYGGSWSEEQIHAQYAWTVDFLVPCLNAEGFTVSTPPSKETFVDTWATAPYQPFGDVIGLVGSNEQMAALEAACPQVAPAAVLWDGVDVSDYTHPLTPPDDQP